MLSLSVYEPIANEILHGGTVPQLGEKVELGGSPLTSQSQNKFWLGDRPPILVEGVELGGRVGTP